MDAYLCRESYEPAVSHELKLSGARILSEHSRPGLVVAELIEGLPRPDPAFASQCLPSPTLVSADSVGKLAHAAFDAVAERLDAAEAWTLHAIAPELEDSRRLAGRARLVGKAADELIHERLRRAHKRQIPWQAANPALPPAVLQLLLSRADEAWVSLATPGPLASGWLEPALAPLGREAIPDDPEAPSSAYRKVEEAYRLLGVAPTAGERVADLGAAPGGWSWTALKRGASVIAVDRAKLEAPVAGHERLRHLKKDATSWEPDEPQDWLLCDAIMVPEKTLALLELWLARGWCRRLVVNAKFKGQDYGVVPKLRAALARAGATRARVKQLAADKNEVTCVAELPRRTRPA